MNAPTIDFAAALNAVVNAGMMASEVTIRLDSLQPDALGTESITSPMLTETIVDAKPCQIGVPTTIFDLRSGNEQRSSELTNTRRQRQLSMDGYYPEVNSTLMIATVDGIEYNILAWLHDSQFTHTELLLEIVEA